jgi:hypothetical protein
MWNGKNILKKIVACKKIRWNFNLLGKFQCILQYSSFDDGLNFNLYLDNIMTYFLNPHFSLSLHNKCNVIISKIHNESIIVL